jgi:hypothetical protein
MTLPCASPDCGQVKRPFSNLLAKTHSPLPSQRGGLQGVIRALSAHLTLGEASQLLVHKRNQFLQGAFVAFIPRQ